MDVIEQIVSLINDGVGWGQAIAVAGCAGAYAVGGIIHIFGGPEGGRKAKGWYIGATLGLIVVLGASSLASESILFFAIFSLLVLYIFLYYV